ncbi:MAG: diguanylate cyclase domain-containing protein, partial [Gammaproteobacteria bacterium]
MKKPHRFQTRVALTMIALVVVIQLASFTAVYVATRNNVVNRARAELSVGNRVLERFLTQRSAQLNDTVDVLSEDFGFKQAVASGDRGTIRSVLLNHGARVNASLAMLIEPDGSVVASTLDTPLPGKRFPFPHLFTRVVNQGSTSAIVQFRGHIYQLVIVPVYAPLPIGWVCMGFTMDDRLANDLKGLTSLDVSFVSRNADGAETTIFSSLSAREQDALKDQFDQVLTSKAGAVVPVTLAHEEFLTLARPLTDNPDVVVTAVLQNSLKVALNPYWTLLEQLVTFTLSALLVAFILAFLISRSLSRPLAILAAAARRIGGGDYAEAVRVDAKDEMAELATALNNMQEGIAEREERIAFQAYHDALTGLVNRASVQQELHDAINHVDRKQDAFAVLMLDINRFKEINDSLGHHTGDQALMELAQRLRKTMRGSELVARLGGDEFLILLPGADAMAAGEAAAKILDAMQPAINIADMQIHLELSIGVALYPDHGAEPETLMRRADIAMYDAKEQHAPWYIYETGRDERYLKRLE